MIGMVHLRSLVFKHLLVVLLMSAFFPFANAGRAALAELTKAEREYGECLSAPSHSCLMELAELMASEMDNEVSYLGPIAEEYLANGDREKASELWAKDFNIRLKQYQKGDDWSSPIGTLYSIRSVNSPVSVELQTGYLEKIEELVRESPGGRRKDKLVQDLIWGWGYVGDAERALSAARQYMRPHNKEAVFYLPNTLVEAGKYEKAISTAMQVTSEWIEGSHETYDRCFDLVARAFAERGELEWAKKAVSLMETPGNREHYFDPWWDLTGSGHIRGVDGSSDNALEADQDASPDRNAQLETLESAFEKSRKSEKGILRAIHMMNIGMGFIDLGELDRALDVFNEMPKPPIFDFWMGGPARSIPGERGKLLRNWAIEAINAGRGEEATSAVLEEVRRAEERLGWDVQSVVMAVLFPVSDALAQEGNSEAATNLLNSAESYFTATKDDPNLKQLAKAYVRVGEIEHADELMGGADWIDKFSALDISKYFAYIGDVNNSLRWLKYVEGTGLEWYVWDRIIDYHLRRGNVGSAVKYSKEEITDPGERFKAYLKIAAVMR